MKKLISMAVLAVVLSFPALAADKEKESAYERVMRTREIRCGYLPYEPYISKDAVTGKLSGLIVDYVNTVAVRQGLTVDWTEEVTIDQVVPALEYGRIDAFCLPSTPDESWAKNLNFSAGLGAAPYYVYVRNDSYLSADALKTAKFLTVDGYALTGITQGAFPEATYSGMPQTTSMAEMYEQLHYKKVDAFVNDPISAALYMKNNPGIIRRFSDTPVVAMRLFLTSRLGDDAMAAFLTENFDADRPDNLALMQTLLKKYNVPDGAILLGEACGKKVNTDKGERLCVPGDGL